VEGEVLEDGEGEEEKTFTRPRFVQDELKMSKRLLIAVLSDKKLQKLQELAFNTTLARFSGDVVYFGNFTAEEQKVGKRVAVGEAGRHLLLQVVRHLAEKLASEYHLFFIVPSSSFIHGRNLERFLNTIDQLQPTYIGQKTGLGSSCGLKAGILLSKPLLLKAKSHMDWCFRNANSHSPSQNLEGCLSHSASIQCSSSSPSSLYISQQFTQGQPLWHQAIVYFGGDTPALARHLLIALAEIHVKEAEKAAKVVESSSVALVNSSLHNLTIEWPPASRARIRSTDRFDRDVYSRFNATHRFNVNDQVVATKLKAEEATNLARLLDGCGLTSTILSAGWMKMDAVRGVDTLLETGGQQVQGERKGTMRCHVVQELAEPEIIPMPFVTENSRISLIVPVNEGDLRASLGLVKSFAKNCIEKGDRVFLMLVFLYSPERSEKNNAADFYKEVKQVALQISKKHKKKDSSPHLLWYSLQTKGRAPTQLELLDLVTAKLDDQTILLLGSPHMEIRPDYFNRVRMNTVVGRQVFCPAPFTQFHPRFAGTPHTLSFNTSQGHFDPLDQGHLSFYKGDYLAARAGHPLPLITSEQQLPESTDTPGHPSACSLLAPQVHALHAPEPSLRVHYQELTCHQLSPRTEQESSCRLRRERSFGTRAQLASLLLSGG